MIAWIVRVWDRIKGKRPHSMVREWEHIGADGKRKVFKKRLLRMIFRRDHFTREVWK